MVTAQPGLPYPLGAAPDAAGTNFAVYSEIAEAVAVSLFTDDGTETVVRLPGRTGSIHHGHLSGVGPGARYGLRVDGPWAPSRGLRCNPAKLLIDPLAHAIDGDVRWDRAVYGFGAADPDRPDTADSAPFVPRCLVVDHGFDWGDDRRPEVPWTETVVYETHVKSLTVRHRGVPEAHRGRYLGLAAPVVIDHLRSLGVTTVELLPVSQFVHDHKLVDQGLRNLWGYQPVGFAAPHNDYATPAAPGAQVTELKEAVKALHAAGIEVVLDVVFNHSGESDHTGPNLSLRGIDNATYYRLSEEDPRRYLNYGGVGNTLNSDHPAVMRLVADSLRRWVEEYHIDGFRFDLATTLGRDGVEFDPVGPFFHLIHQDPVLNRVKLIAEPWDVGPGGYRLGGFPADWREWNDRYRSTVRDFWRPSTASIADLAGRLTGSADVFAHPHRRTPTASVNYVTSHDGFTLSDLVSYDHRHNEANGEANHDGNPDNRSWNGGIEGPTDDPTVVDLRDRRRRSLLTTLLVSQGVPMLLGGDELGRTQRGNNNAYPQDNEISWYEWDDVDAAHLDFVRRIVALRRDHPVLRQTRWLTGSAPLGSPIEDVAWLHPDGTAMTPDRWHDADAQALMIHLNGATAPDGAEPSAGGPSVLLMLNGTEGPADFVVPGGLGDVAWVALIDTARSGHPPSDRRHAGDRLTVAALAMVVLTEGEA